MTHRRLKDSDVDDLLDLSLYDFHEELADLQYLSYNAATDVRPPSKELKLVQNILHDLVSQVKTLNFINLAAQVDYLKENGYDV